MDEMLALIPSKHTDFSKVTLEECKAEALKYESRSEMGHPNKPATDETKYASSIYRKIKKEGWEKECFAHMELVNNLPKKSNLSNRYIYAFEFPKSNKAYIGLTCNLQNRFRAHKNKEGSVYDFIQESGEQPISKVLTEQIPQQYAAEAEASYMEEYLSKGWELLNKRDAGALGYTRKKWSKEFFLKERQKHPEIKTMKEFYALFPYWARALPSRYGFQDDVEKGLKPYHIKWDKDLVVASAAKCKNQRQLFAEYRGGYAHAKRHGYLADLVYKTGHTPKWSNGDKQVY